jgi:hypothetical protein
MKRLSLVTLASAAVLALGASAAQARDVKAGEGQATTAQTQAKAIALWYQAEANQFNELKRYQTRHQATTAQAQAAKKVALWYQAEANRFNATERAQVAKALAALQFRAAAEYFPELKRYQTRHQTMYSSIPPDMRGQDQLSTPGWSGELPF